MGTPFFEGPTVCGPWRLELGDWLIRRLTRHLFQARGFLMLHHLSGGTCFGVRRICFLVNHHSFIKDTVVQT